MKRFNPRKAFQQIRAESQRHQQVSEEWAQRERQKWAADSTRRRAFNRLMQLFPREAAGTLDIPKAVALMVEFAQTIPTNWLQARVRFVSDRLAALSTYSAGRASFKEIALDLLLRANAGDHARVAGIFTEAMRGDADEMESFRLCLSNWLVDKVVDSWPPLPEELKPPTEASAAEMEVLSGTLPAQEEWLPASQAVERAEQQGHPISLKWLTQNARKHGVRIRRRQLPGSHKREVQWPSLAACLLKRPRPKNDADEETADRLHKAQEQKRRERPLD
jgi:hypothetical protein